MYLTARRLHEVLAGQCLLVGELRHPSYAEHNLAGRTVTSVRSVGKHIFTRFNDGLRACFETGWLGGVVALGVGELLVDRWLLRPDLTRSSGAIIAHV